MGQTEEKPQKVDRNLMLYGGTVLFVLTIILSQIFHG